MLVYTSYTSCKKSKGGKDQNQSKRNKTSIVVVPTTNTVEQTLTRKRFAQHENTRYIYFLSYTRHFLAIPMPCSSSDLNDPLEQSCMTRPSRGNIGRATL